MTISKNYDTERFPTDVDMSAQAVTIRLKRVSQLRRLCISLGKAQLESIEVEKADETDVAPQQEEPNL